MLLEGVELNKLSHLISQQVEQVTCLECCKTYIAPETAPCGHTLCHVCWKRRRTCPLCSSAVNRKTTKLNLPLQSLTEHINTLGETFERLFNVKLDEFMLDTPGEFTSEDDPAKNVKEWLASSQNQFSAATLTSGKISQEKQHVEVPVVSKALVHTSTKTVNKPTKVVCTTIAQDDWDKIEPMSDTEDKNKENVIGPMDIEAFSIDDNFYTMKNPRRSSRKKEGTIMDLIVKNPQTSPEKQSSKECNSESDKKSNNMKQNWNNVKRMRKEFSKLNKKNRNKLNVSIEMYKKTQHSSNKSNIDIPSAVSEQVYNIDDDTPNIENNETNTRMNITDDYPNRHYDSNIEKPTHTLNDTDPIKNDDNNSKKDLEENRSELTKVNTSNAPGKKNIVNFLYSKSFTSRKQQSQKDNFEETNNSKIRFLKKGFLCPRSERHNHNIVTSNHYIDTNSANVKTNNIEITIKVGDSVTNILIKNDNNDAPLKTYADCEIQVSLGPHNISLCDNIHLNGIKDKENMKCVTDEVVQQMDANNKDILPNNKSTSTKKNTASAETATAQFEITESVEKELSKIMECDTNNYKNSQCYTNKQATQIHASPSNSRKIFSPTSKDVEIMDDLQIFDSFSTNDNTVKLLKNTKPVPSEILLPSSHTKKYKCADKRSRETNNDYELPNSKKIKTNREKVLVVKSNITPQSNSSENIRNDSEVMNYEAVIDQVFANIDMDIENKDTNTHHTKPKKVTNDKETISQTQRSKIMSVPSTIHTEPSANLKEYYNQKDSENMFSIIEKENENCEVTMKNNVSGSTQKHIQDLLTPVVCRNLDLCTPQVAEKDDDSDKSIVEDTPQKSISYSKLRQKNGSSIRELDQSQQINKPEITTIVEKNIEKISIVGEQSQSVINLTESVEFNKSNKDKTIIECATKKHTLETPLTINKFVDQIKHKSTPVARKSLNFENDNDNADDPEITLCPTAEIAKNTQEKEFMSKAFENTPQSPKIKTLALKNLSMAENKKFCIAGSCLTLGEITKLKTLCTLKKWTYVDKYTKNVTHLVVGVDEENKSQRSVKYMSALAAGKWIVSFEWVEKCLKAKRWVDEVNFEVLDSTGEPGPKRSRIAKRKLFQGITFFCMPPFSVLDVDTLKTILEAAGGRVVDEAKLIRVTEETPAPALLLAEPENTQEDRFIYLTMELSIVPVNYEWVLNCLGNYTLGSVQDLLLCPSSLLPPITSQWPSCLLAREYDD